MAHPLARIIEQLKREPSRTGSIVITVFGDAIVPRGAEKCWLWQPAAGRMDRAFGCPDSGGSGHRDPSGSLRRGRERPTLAQRELAAASHRGCLSEIHENL